MGIIVFNGRTSKEFRVEVQHPPKYIIPERDYTVTSIPGRNGELVYDNGSFKNTTRTYEIAIDATQEEYSRVVSSVVAWLHSASGYARLEDSYDPDFYRMAFYQDSLEIENIFQEAGQGTLSFKCKPQRFLRSGELTTEFTESGKIFNPTFFNAKPLLHVYGTGSVTINSKAIFVTEASSNGVTLDCENHDAYAGTINYNDKITGDYPELIPGDNGIGISGFTKVIVTPRWWTI